MIINLDSFVFKNRPFLSWLRLHKDDYEIYISIVVYIEVLLWYLFMEIPTDVFERELAKMNIHIVNIDKEICQKTALIAKGYNNLLPFKHHARDYIIGATALETKADALITYKKIHFHWLEEKGVKVLTPEELVEK
ncbi:MAG: PIN domain-containing protein [Candidatus Asgardarchaeia archaeon]